MKQYILVLESVEDHMVPVIAAHATLIAHLNFQNRDDYKLWLKNSFKKVVCKINQKEFDKVVKDVANIALVSEFTQGVYPVAIVVCPQTGEYPNVIKFAKMWKPNYEKSN